MSQYCVWVSTNKENHYNKAMTPKIFSIAFSLFLLMDPIGNIPLYISLLKDIDPKRQRMIIIRELLIALAIMLFFSFLGDYILELLHVSKETIMIAGGMILFIIAIRMIFPATKETHTEPLQKEEPFIVPLAIPLVAGPSVLAAIMIYSSQKIYLTMASSIIIAWLASFFILISAPFLKQILGKRGIIACERLMGLLLTFVAVQLFLDGITSVILLT